MNPTPKAIFLPALAPQPKGGTTVRIPSRQTDNAYCVCGMTTLPGDGVPLHVHDHG